MPSRIAKLHRAERARRAAEQRKADKDTVDALIRKHGRRILPDLRRTLGAPVPKFYWAYGSNLCHKQMKARCPDARPYGPLTVPKCELVFRGVADIDWHRTRSTQGGLWKITSRCEAALDRAEGAGHAYEKKYLRIRADGEEHRVLYYQMIAKGKGQMGVMPPWQIYLDLIERGYRDFGLDLADLDDAVRRAWDNKDPDDDIRARHERRGKPALARPAALILPDDLSDPTDDLFRHPTMEG